MITLTTFIGLYIHKNSSQAKYPSLLYVFKWYNTSCTLMWCFFILHYSEPLKRKFRSHCIKWNSNDNKRKSKSKSKILQTRKLPRRCIRSRIFWNWITDHGIFVSLHYSHLCLPSQQWSYSLSFHRSARGLVNFDRPITWKKNYANQEYHSWKILQHNMLRKANFYFIMC